MGRHLDELCGRLRRIGAMTLAVVVGIVVLGVSFAIETTVMGFDVSSCSRVGGKSVLEEITQIEMLTLPFSLAFLSGGYTIRLLRLRSIENELGDTVEPMLLFLRGYTGLILTVASLFHFFEAGNAVGGLAHAVTGVPILVHACLQDWRNRARRHRGAEPTC
jgi:hypothetical protein